MVSRSFFLLFVSCLRFLKFSIYASHQIRLSSIDLSLALSISFPPEVKWAVNGKSISFTFQVQINKKKTAMIKIDLNKLEIILKESSGSALRALHWYKNEIDS